MNIIIEMKNYVKSSFRSGYRSLTAKDSNGNQLAVDLNGQAIVDFTELAIQKGIERIIDNGGSAEAFTVTLPTGVTLTAGLQTHLIDKYSADPLVSSLTFA